MEKTTINFTLPAMCLVLCTLLATGMTDVDVDVPDVNQRQPQPEPPGLPEGYVADPDGGFAYKIPDRDIEWPYVKAICEKDGGQFASIDSIAKMRHLWMQYPEVDGQLVGIYKMIDTGDWTAVSTGLPLPSLPWASGEPEEGGKHCAQMDLERKGLITMNCHGGGFAVCEIPLVRNNATNVDVDVPLNSAPVVNQTGLQPETPELPEGYVAHPDIGYAYKIIESSHPWPDFKVICEEDGGQFASIDSMTELRHLWIQRPGTSGLSVGIHRMVDTGDWMAVSTGSLLQSLPWASGEPERGGKHCARIDFEKKGLVSIYCHLQDRFGVCEILLVRKNATNVDVDVPVSVAPDVNHRQPQPDSPGLPEGYVAYPDIGFAYKITDPQSSWLDFKAICAEDGGQFALIDSLTKLRYIWSQMPGAGKLHVGIYRMFDTGDWTAVSTGSLLPSLPWALGEPEKEDERCAQIDFKKKGLATVRCDFTPSYHEFYECGVCEIPLFRNDVTNVDVDVPLNVNETESQPELPGLPAGYVAYPDIGFAYKIAESSHAWRSSRAMCAEDGGRLASIDSMTKMRHLYIQRPGTTHLRVGILRMFDTGDWIAVSTGSLLSSLPWASGEPEKGGGDCARIDFAKKGLVTTDSNYIKSDSVCEIPLAPNNTTNVNVDGSASVVNRTELQPETPDLPEGYVAHPDIGFAYKIPDRIAQWPSFREICAEDGGQFASIDSIAKLRHLWIQEPLRVNLNVGIFRMFDTGDWIALSTGALRPSLPWASGEPKNGENHCAQIDFKNKGLVTSECLGGGEYLGVCEIPLVRNNTTNVKVDVPVPDVNQTELQSEVPGLPKGYVAYPDIGFAYKITYYSYTWREFKAICAEDGGQFALIDSWTKLRYIWSQIPEKSQLHVGIYRMFDTDDWIALSAGALLPSLPWASGEPEEGDKRCARIDFEKKGLATVHCGFMKRPWHFRGLGVCEIPLLRNIVINVNVDVPPPVVKQTELQPELPEGYVAHPDIGFAYKIIESFHSWEDFRAICANDGGQFASIDSSTKLRYIWTQTPGTDRLHVGIYRMFDTGDWMAVSTGSLLPSLPWASGEPEMGEKHCAQIDFEKKGLVTSKCVFTVNHYGVCEIPLVRTNRTNVDVDFSPPVVNRTELQPELPDLPEGYVAHPDIGFAYKIIDIPHAWQDFKAFCAEDGGQFATIDSWSKFCSIRSQMPRASKLHVGLFRMFDTGDWTAVSTGALLPSLPWASDEPESGEKHCAQIDYSQKGLVAIDCRNTHDDYGVCEIPLIRYNTTDVDVDVPVNVAPVVNQTELQPETPGLPAGYVAHPDIGFAYKITDHKSRWLDFEEICARDGGQFASIDSFTKLRYIWMQMPGAGRLHVGVHRMFDTGDWTAVSTGSPLLSLPWVAGEPRQGRRNHCAYIDFHVKGLVSYNCFLQNIYAYGVCEIPIVRNNATNHVNVDVPAVNLKQVQPEPPVLPKGYAAYPDIGFAYEIIDDYNTWIDLRAICARHGGQVALIDSVEKLRYIWTQKPGIDKLHVGIFKNLGTGNWTAVSTGLSLSSLPWASGEPAVEQRQHCAQIDYSKKGLVTTACNRGSKGVCEIPLVRNITTIVNRGDCPIITVTA